MNEKDRDPLARSAHQPYEHRCLSIDNDIDAGELWLHLPAVGQALALAPHPDDPEVNAVTLRALAHRGWRLTWAILTSGWSGVRDDMVGSNRAAKRELREKEQRAAARAFGLSENTLHFLLLAEDDQGQMTDTADNWQQFASFLDIVAPNLVLLPFGDDSNHTHQLVYQWFGAWRKSGRRSITALYNEDPKSRNFRPTLEVRFGREAAHWKAGLLECHCSQSQRNQVTRGMTFAERILTVNQRAAGQWSERFVVEQSNPGPE